MPLQPLIAALASALLGAALSAAAGSPLPPERRALVAAAVALVVAAAATPFFAGRHTASFFARVTTALALACGPAAAALAGGVAGSAGRALATLAVGGPFLYLLISLGSCAAPVLGARGASVAALAAAALLLSGVFAATPLFEYGGDSPAVRTGADLVLAVNPLAALAFPAFGVDWIRRPILYASSPISALPFRYPRPAESAVAFAGFGLILEAVRIGLARFRARTLHRA